MVHVTTSSHFEDKLNLVYKFILFTLQIWGSMDKCVQHSYFATYCMLISS